MSAAGQAAARDADDIYIYIYIRCQVGRACAPSVAFRHETSSWFVVYAMTVIKRSRGLNRCNESHKSIVTAEAEALRKMWKSR